MTNKGIKAAVTAVTILVLGVLGAFKFYEKVDNGMIGVRYSLAGGIKDDTLSQGVKFVGFDKVIQYPIRLQTIQAKDVSVSTSDGKKTTVNIKYDYKVDSTRAAKMYKEFGNITSEDIENGWLKSKLQKEAREVYAKYSLLKVLSGESTAVEAELLKNFSEAVESKGFIVEDVTVGVPEVDSETQKTIDAIIKSGQENEKAKLDAETAKTKADADAQVAKTKADSDAYQKVTEANAEAEANEKIKNSISPEIIDYTEAKARLDHGWVTTITNGDAIVDTTDGENKGK